LREEAESMPPIGKSWRTLETHLAGKNTKKRQYFDHSTHPAGAENLHFTLKGETRRAPGAANPPLPDGLGR
jgi:hypothetical protein